MFIHQIHYLMFHFRLRIFVSPCCALSSYFSSDTVVFIICSSFGEKFADFNYLQTKIFYNFKLLMVFVKLSNVFSEIFISPLLYVSKALPQISGI